LQLPASFTRPPRPRKRKEFGEFGVGETLLTRVLALSAEARLGESGQGVRRAPSSAQAATSFNALFVVPGSWLCLCAAFRMLLSGVSFLRFSRAERRE
jgi:hypothetical protein